MGWKLSRLLLLILGCMICLSSSPVMGKAMKQESGNGGKVAKPRVRELTSTQAHPPGRLVVSVLWFDNNTGDPSTDHWEYGIEGLVRSALGNVKAILMRGGAEFAARELGIAEGSPIDSPKVATMHSSTPTVQERTLS